MNYTPDNTPRATLTVVEAARVLGIGRAAAYAAVNSGKLPSIRIGRKVLVPKAALMRMLDGACPEAHNG